MHHTLQGHNNENSKQIFTEKEFRGLSPNFHIHSPVSDSYVFSHDRSAFILLQEIMWTDHGNI
jgi:hypothetical protein